MKKTLGLLALTLAVSAVATAEQDFLKKVELDVKGKYSYQDRATMKDKPETGDLLGNEGFKDSKRIKTEFEKTLSGTVVLQDEGGFELDGKVTHNEFTDREGEKRTGYGVKVSQELKLRKPVMIGNLKANWYAKYNGSKTRKYDEKRMKNDKDSKRGDNKFESGVEFKAHELFEVNPAVYYIDKKTNDEWGVRVGTKLGKSGELAKTGLGTVSYDVAFNHELKYVGSRKTPSRKRSVVNLKYVQELKYTTPSFYGVSGSVALNNEWKRNTRNSGWSNEFVIPVGVEYKHTFKTAAGDIMVKPYANYEVLKRSTVYKKSNKANKKLTTEENQAVLGLKVSLTPKR